MYFDLSLSASRNCFKCNASCILKIVERNNGFGIPCLCFVVKIILIYCRVLLLSPFYSLFLEFPHMYSFVNKATN